MFDYNYNYNYPFLGYQRKNRYTSGKKSDKITLMKQ